MEPRRRRRWALALTLEMLVVAAAAAWGISTQVEDAPVVWACAALVAVWFASFMACVAVRPSAARIYGLVSVIVMAVAPIGFAFVASR